MSAPDRIEGLAIVSADGMIADASGIQPAALRIEADRQFLFAMIERAAALAHGRHSAESDPPPAQRRRIILTRAVARIAADPGNADVVLWNPAGAALAEAWAALGLRGGLLVVIGGTEAFGHFLGAYDAFHLSRAGNVRLPGGRPVFPGVPAQTPEAILQACGLRLASTRTLDEAADLVLTSWRR